MFPSMTMCTQLRTLRTGSYAPVNVSFLLSVSFKFINKYHVPKRERNISFRQTSTISLVTTVLVTPFFIRPGKS